MSASVIFRTTVEFGSHRGMRRRSGGAWGVRAGWLAVLVALTRPPGFAVAQQRGPEPATVRGVVGATSGEPVEGALVILVAPDGERVDATLSGAAGEYLLEAPHPGTYRVRAERIGYGSTSSPPLSIDAGAIIQYRIVAPTRRIPLENVEVAVEDDRGCDMAPDEALLTARLWDEARKALRAAEVTAREDRYRYELTRYERELDPEDLRILEERIRITSGFSDDPLVSISPERLADVGYATLESRDAVYYAPDEEVLLSDAFLDRHCFRVRPGGGEAPGLIGLAFEPTKDHGLPDIRGTLWIERSTSMLRYLEFRYTDLPYPRPVDGRTGDAGGRVGFERMPDGRWIVSRWWVRMPVVGTKAITGYVPGVHERYLVAGMREEGGAVTAVFTALGERVARGGRAVVAGLVFDSIAGQPVAGAKVRLEGTDREAVSDSSGRFLIEDVAEGRYSITFAHPRIDSALAAVGGRVVAWGATAGRAADGVGGVAGVEGAAVIAGPPRLSSEVALTRGDTAQVQLAIPSLSNLLVRVCDEAGSSAVSGEGQREPAEGAAAGDAARDGAAVAGRVRAAGTGTALPGAVVTLAVGDSPERMRTRTDGRGFYRFCSVPADGPFALRATFMGSPGIAVEGRLRPGAGRLRDLFVETGLGVRVTERAPVDADSGAVRVYGRLLDAETGAPISGAEVGFRASDVRLVTDVEGRFTARVGSGLQTVTVRHVGYGERTARFALRPGRAAAVEVRMAPKAIALEPLAVSVRRLSPAEQAERASGTRSDVLTRAEIEQTGYVRHIGELVRGRFPGLTFREGVVSDPRTRSSVRVLCIGTSRGPTSFKLAAERLCDALPTFVNGIRIADPAIYLRRLPPSSIESIEYLTSAEAVVRLGTGAANGVLVIYTRGNGPYAAEGDGEP